MSIMLVFLVEKLVTVVGAYETPSVSEETRRLDTIRIAFETPPIAIAKEHTRRSVFSLRVSCIS